MPPGKHAGGQLLQRTGGVFDEEQLVSEFTKARQSLMNHHRATRSSFKCLADELMTINPFPGDGDKQITACDRSRIERETGRLGFGQTFIQHLACATEARDLSQVHKISIL